MVLRLFDINFVVRRRRQRRQQGQPSPPPTTTSPPPQPQQPDQSPHTSRAPSPDLEAGIRLSPDPSSTSRDPQATQSQVDGVTVGHEGLDATAEPFLFQLEVVIIPWEGWEVSLRAGSGPAWLWWSVVVVVVVLLVLLVAWLLGSAVARVLRQG